MYSQSQQCLQSSNKNTIVTIINEKEFNIRMWLLQLPNAQADYSTPKAINRNQGN